MIKKRFLSLLCCILLFLSFVLPVSAAETGSVTVLFQHENEPVAGASFALYKAAEWNGSEYSLVVPFAGYPVDLSDDPTSDDWKAVAFTLSAYAARDNITPLAVGETDETGTLKFENLTDGLYLLIGATVQKEETLLLPQPMLVSVPYTMENGETDYEVVTEPKYETRLITEETVTRRALKIWKDEGNEDKRPQDVTVQLLCDGEVYEEQVLNAANNWAYTWDGLDAAHNWQLTEKDVPQDYTVQITQEGVTFTVTNTNDNPPPTTPGEPNEPNLPQTGLLWWPVPVLAGIGVVTLFLGIFLLMRKKGEPHE